MKSLRSQCYKIRIATSPEGFGTVYSDDIKFDAVIWLLKSKAYDYGKTSYCLDVIF